MKSTTLKSTTIATYCCLAAAAVVSFLMPDDLGITPATAVSPPGSIRVNGVVFDFRGNHPDFNVTPAAGPGHYAGNVKLALGADRRPVFVGEPGLEEGGGIDDVHLIAHWRFDEGSGSSAGDAEGDNDGTLLNGPTWVAGQNGGGLHFDGNDDYVNVPSSPETQIRGDISFAGWFKLDNDFDASTPATQVIMEKFLDTEHDFHVGLAGVDYNRPEVPKGALVFKVEAGPTSDYYRYKWTNRTSWTAGVWYHFVCVLNSADTAENVIFIDGVDDTSAVDAGGVGFIDTEYNADFRVGGKTIDYNGVATDLYFEGAIDDVMIFSRVVNEADFSGGAAMGFRVDDQWRDQAGQPIAPHLYAASSSEYLFGLGPGDEVPLVNAPSLGGTRDTWDSSIGPYGGANRGPSPTFTTGNTMPIISEPTNVPASEGDVQIAGSVTIDSNRHFNDLRIVGGSKTLQISGNVTILVDGNLRLEDECRFEFLPGATLDLYVKGWVLVLDGARFNMNTWDPSSCRIYMLGDYGSGANLQPGLFKLEDNGRVCATIIAPQGKLLIREEGHVYGGYMGEHFKSRAESGFHRDTALSFGSPPQFDACGILLSDTAGTQGPASSAGITSAVTFDQWFGNKLGVNLSVSHSILLTDNGTGVYEYFTTDFHPIDDRLFGNEGAAHNHYLTFKFASTFTYEQCTDQFFEFQGNDDAWVFIDGRLVMDLGGVLPGTPQHVPIDRLGLVDGETYDLHFFYAQRQGASANFGVRTNLDLFSGPLQGISAAYD